MKTFLFIFLAGYAVRCDDLNYYVVQMPENDVPTKEFNVYWNAPTMQCKSKGIHFDDLYEKYGIIQNTDDTFRGDKISILYDPGDFPALLRNSTSGEIKYRNGGVPQEGDLIEHLDTYQQVLEQSIPDKDFNGVGIIDFESWRPVFRQNFGDLTPYKDMSYEIEKQRHWWWKKEWIQEEAKRRFEAAGREFMQATLALSKKMRPRAIWGYYGFPYCFNMASNNMKETCADKVNQENDRISWLWQESTALYPSVYSSASLSTRQLAALIRGRVKEAARMVRGGAPILPYFWYRYRDSGFLNKTTIGFGDRAIDEECPESIFLFIMQLILGTGLSGVLTCVVYAKLTRPEKLSRDGVGFSKKAVISMRDGRLCLMMRAWDLNYDHIISSEFTAHFVNTYRTKEGEVIRYYARSLTLQQRQFLLWPVTLVHVIDETSPLYGYTPELIAHNSYEITVSLKGASASMGTFTQSQTSYLPKEVAWGFRFPPVVKYDSHKQKYVIDHKKLDLLEPVDTPYSCARDIYRTPTPIKEPPPTPGTPSNFSEKVSSFQLARSSSFRQNKNNKS